MAPRLRVPPLDHFIASHQAPNPAFIKIDVEGFECDVLEGTAATMVRCQPDLLVELYGVTEADNLQCTRCALAFVRPFGYSVVHVESGQPIGESASFMPLIGHLYATPSGDRADAASRGLVSSTAAANSALRAPIPRLYTPLWAVG